MMFLAFSVAGAGGVERICAVHAAGKLHIRLGSLRCFWAADLWGQ